MPSPVFITPKIEIHAEQVGPLQAALAAFKMSEEEFVRQAVEFALRRVEEGGLEGPGRFADALELRCGFTRDIRDRTARVTQVAERLLIDLQGITTAVKARVVAAETGESNSQ